ncbi:MAG TPA: TauD/TfdA family dioxygenase [Geminicoccaceae bacterium]|nr:TauD/TfdA family dioxygenase [Geminicoccaceae bacterium]
MTGAALNLPAAPPNEAGTPPGRSRAQPVVDMAELAAFASGRRIVAAESSGPQIRIAWDDGTVQRFHPLWLRSECACPACRDRVTLERTFDQFRLPLDLAATTVEVTDQGALRLVWPPDGHISLFDPGWLHQVARGAGPWAAGGGRPRLWRSELVGAIPTFGYQAIMTEPRALHDWLIALRDVGLTLLSDVPAEAREVERIARRISLPRDSNFGAVFDVMTMANANSNAYTAIELPPHVDLPTREYQPGYQFFHCLDNQAAGGESTYVDGFAVAEHLRAAEPDTFRTLREVPIGFRFLDQVSDYVWHAPALVVDQRDDLREIRFIPWLMAPLAAAPERFEPVYQALRRFGELTRDPRFQIRLKLTAGTMSAFDNRRVLHGRAAFAPNSGRRHFQGCYIEREEVESRIRVLERGL